MKRTPGDLDASSHPVVRDPWSNGGLHQRRHTPKKMSKTASRAPLATKMPRFGHVFAPFPNKKQRMAISETVSVSVPGIRPEKHLPFRVSAIAGSAGLAGILFYWHTDAHIAGHPAWLIAGLLYATLIGFTALFIFRFFPKLGSFMEFTSISRLLLAIISVTSPKIAVAVSTSPALNATIIVLGAILIRAATRARRPAGTRSGFFPRSNRPARTKGAM